MSSLNKPLIELKDVSIIRDTRVILSGINLCVNKGDFIAITGPNGGGKTTLLRLILGLVEPSSGQIVIPKSDDYKVGYLPQKNSVDSHFPITVREVISSGLLEEKQFTKSEKDNRIEEILELVELSDYSSRVIGKLSGGQLQRALFGRAIVSHPSILILDEPLSYLDKHFEQHLYNIMEDIAKDTTILLVSHQMNHISGMANRHIIIDRGLTECTHSHHFANECDD